VVSRPRKPEENVPLGFNLYCSVSPDEMQALQRVVGAARELCVLSPSDDGDGAALSEAQLRPRDLAVSELAEALSVLDAVRTRRNGSDARSGGTLAPWLHEYLRRSERGNTAWKPVELEQTPSLSATERSQEAA
jgi:hypothetical protein